MKKLSILLVLAGALYAIARRRAARLPVAAPPPGIDELEVAEDLAALDSELDEGSDPIDEVLLGIDAYARPEPYGGRAARGSGELYDLHVVDAADPELLDEDRANAEGQTWFESLEASAVEAGPVPERVLDIVDDRDTAAIHATDTRDIPVADRGSGGPRGL